MAEIAAADVMKLRNRTGLSMMECKKALVEVGGNADAAEDLLRKKMKGKMDARTDRAAGEGRIAVAIHRPDAGGATPHASIVEVRAETDFTAKNDQFIAMVAKVADAVAELPAGEVAAPAQVTAMIDEVRIKTGENCSYARGRKIAGSASSVFGAYVHHDGKTGVLLHAEGDISADLLKDIGMHVVANPIIPKGVNAADIPADIVEKERKFRIDQAMESGKPKEIAEKIVEGGMRKFFEDVALLEQPFVKDPARKVKDVVGPKARVLGFWRWAVGESN
ncbi:MAG: translation elongation factor Ts [Phycisphaeraceae bacterium]|nr:translation elongation factor Ts [Phycisphaeraceae bacterium]